MPNENKENPPYVDLVERLEVGVAELGAKRRIMGLGDGHIIYVPMSDEEKDVCGIDRDVCTVWIIRVQPKQR